jgi:ABC-type bacteriocin/lantibiotic exporter with double-glycine peptidase domain
MSLSDAAIQGLTGIIARSFVSLIFVLFYVIIMCILSLPIALIGIVLSLINIGLMWGVQRVRYDFTVATQHYNSKFMGFTIGTITYIETIKSSGSELNVFKKWASLFTKITNSSQRAQILNTYLSMLPGFFNSLGTIAIFFVGGHLLINQSFTIGLLMGLQGLIGFLLSPVIELSNSFKVIQGIKINMARVNDVMEQKIDPIFSQEKDLKKDNISPQITINRKIEKYDRLSGSFEFRDVTFGYSRLEPPLIENFNLIVKPGQRIALIGSTGCGKSTLGKLLTGLLEPWSGEILYDGKKRSTFDRNILVDSITSVDQEIFLFSGTIRENILMLDNTVMDHLMIQAAKDACIHDEILNKKSDYNHVLIENGRNLSGGQRQRLEIARSLVCDPQILILDEATSSLDSNMEAQIIRNVRRRGCSCLIIAHRLSTIRDCDEIILLDKGKVIQRGSHEQLKGQPGIYCDLIAKEGS